MRVLVTGADGFVGSHLIELLLRQPGIEVIATVLGAVAGPALRDIAPSLPVETVDIRDPQRVRDVIATAAPARIVHLAAQPFVPASVSDPRGTFEANILGGVSLLEAARALGEASGQMPAILIISSGEVYGRVDTSRQPITEDVPFNPGNPYAASKASLDLISCAYARTYGMDVLVARPFNHAGPRQAPSFVCSEFALRFAEFSAGRSEPVLHVGNTDARRDFTDVRDVVAAYWKLFDRQGSDMTFNVCSGQATAIGEIIQLLSELTGIRPTIITSDRKIRSYETPVMVGSHERITRATGWIPTIPLRDTLRDVVGYWKARLASSE